MALTSVRVQFGGVWYDMTLDAATGLYKATLTAPSTPQTVPILVRAVNSAGYQAEAETSLEVKWELVPPVVSITSPTAGSWYTNAQTPVSFTLTDEAGGAGVERLPAPSSTVMLTEGAPSLRAAGGVYTQG